MSPQSSLKAVLRTGPPKGETTNGNSKEKPRPSDTAAAYRITVPAPGRYTVKLHFCENFDQVNSPGQRVFSILMGGKEVLKDLDVYKEAGYQAALVKTVQADVTGGVLTIDFRKNSQWGPMINAIEVMSK